MIVPLTVIAPRHVDTGPSVIGAVGAPGADVGGAQTWPPGLGGVRRRPSGLRLGEPLARSESRSASGSSSNLAPPLWCRCSDEQSLLPKRIDRHGEHAALAIAAVRPS